MKWKESTLTNKLTDWQTGWIVYSCPHTYRVVYSGINSTDFIPHTALGPCQIYSYPWRSLIRDLEQDFTDSSRILAVSFLCCFFFFFFHPCFETQREAKVGISQVTWIESHSATCTYAHPWCLLLGLLHSNTPTCWQRADCSGFCCSHKSQHSRLVHESLICTDKDIRYAIMFILWSHNPPFSPLLFRAILDFFTFL